MTPPNPTTTSSKRRRPVYTKFTDDSRGRIDPPPPPGPARKPISLAELEEICASWDFPRGGISSLTPWTMLSASSMTRVQGRGKMSGTKKGARAGVL
ncbi:hypothetical protein CC77DRAFT_1025713 [Alternaria alternata]|uniref:Uncharacterized protein n=1 Tax=Alternaria alternata TaxID=5599 RepID=A0A177D4I0_ALTAL|nr:hypothetical protein CC77DRAFT_1025713 [Alternaria alternata]OAG14564.1 hypothetical protein CC77DRAFT_1025713 [Alternaria alternata]